MGTEQVITTPDDLVRVAWRGLSAEARKCETFEEFEAAFWQGKRGLYWRVTFDPESFMGPRDMVPVGGGGRTAGGIVVTSDLALWVASYTDPDETGGRPRGHAAIIDMSAVGKRDYYQADRGFGNEFFIDDPTMVQVLAVLPIDAALYLERAWDAAQPQGPQELMEFYRRARAVVAADSDVIG
jgi:hypothetical protein